MLIGIGGGAPGESLEALLLACHARIRHFSALAVAVGEAEQAAPQELSRSCERILRYFREALPLHVRDEEESLLPRLLGKEAALDAALQALRAEHEAHGPALKEVLGLCERLQQAPADGVELQRSLSQVAVKLQREFEAHLRAEEQMIFPRLGAYLTPQEQLVVVNEMRDRRRA